MKQKILDKLQWNQLLENLASHTQTEEGRESCQRLKPELNASQVDEQWQKIEPLRRLISTGYRPPIGDLAPMHSIFRAASLGQLLDGESFWSVLTLLKAVQHYHRFAMDFSEKHPILLRYQKTTYYLPKLANAIEKAISPEGDILDTASPELTRIRRQKAFIRQKIERDIKALLTDNELETYLQDKFFTMRKDRYVVPIRLDGRGRVQGAIHDTSDSGQTLYIEPASIRPLNENLQELELSEKLEILNIFRELSAFVSAELGILKDNYNSLIDLDITCAKAAFAVACNANIIELSNAPCLELYKATHPLLEEPTGSAVVANDVWLSPEQRLLIVSGPNAGGKTIVLKTVGIIHLMAKAGLLIPAAPESKIYLFERLFIEMGDNQNITANLSTFSGHVLGLKPILEDAKSNDLVLLDELATGTEPLTGSAIGQAVLEELSKKSAFGIVTTHFDNLKALAVNDSHFRNGSMEFSTESLRPTYRLILDIPGQSYGIELAEQMGLPDHVTRRARELRGSAGNSLDRLVENLQARLAEAHAEKRAYEKLRFEMDAAKFRWESERKALQESKQSASEKIKRRYQGQVDSLRSELNQTMDELKTALKQIKRQLPDEAVAEIVGNVKQKQLAAQAQVQGMEQSIIAVGDDYEFVKDMPGEAVTEDNLKVGAKVYVVSLQHEATITKISEDTPPQIEVSAGLIKLKPSVQDLRIIKDGQDSIKAKARAKGVRQKPQDTKAFVLPTRTNSIDLRGLDIDSALNKTWGFIDKAVLRGESNVILIHGHGTDKLKRGIRTALTKDSPYQLDFRPGVQEEGGDGVTVVQLHF